MLTKLTIRNFKRFNEVEIELGNPVVFIGPNNSGKTSALQALALWQIGLKRWNERRAGQKTPEKRPGVTMNRRDLVALPVPDANLLWRKLHVRNIERLDGQQRTRNVRIDIIVEGVTRGRNWKCGLEFDYANMESFYCRPLRLEEGRTPERMPIPEEAGDAQIAFLPPMSGLAATETRLDHGAISVRIGEGRTAEVLRNLCYSVKENHPEKWNILRERIKTIFGSELDSPRYIAERGEVVMTYRERGVTLDLSSTGRGLQQTLLLLAYMHANPGAALLLDEPDAHLEILRQRQIYQLLTDVGHENGSQIIAASHSEILLNEAAGRDMVVAFVGAPHRIDNRGSQVLKALRDIGFEQYYQAEQTGWVLYLEGSTDLSILQAFAKRLGHDEALAALDHPFVHYAGNQPQAVQRHYQGLREALPALKGIALFDRLEGGLPDMGQVEGLMWKRRETENYLCAPATLEAYASESSRSDAPGPLFIKAEAEKRAAAMREAIGEISGAMEKLGRGSPWDEDAKVSEDFLKPLFSMYFSKLGLPNLMARKNFHELARFIPKSEIANEIHHKLDAIAQTASAASAQGAGSS